MDTFDTIKLVNDFPFLIPKNFETPYYGDWTYLDDMPIGWKESFGIALCHELRKALIEADEFETYEILQVKEKFGALRWYDNSNSSKIREVIRRYEYLSRYVCAQCGSPATVVSTGWVIPFCELCASSVKIKSVSIGPQESQKEQWNLLQQKE